MQYGADVLTPVDPATAAPAGLFDLLLDDAAMFPPGNADPTTAITEHLRYQASALGRFVGPLLVHVDRWADFAAAHAATGSQPIDVVVIGAGANPETIPGVRVLGFELPVYAEPLPPVPDGCFVACEVRADNDGAAVLRAISDSAGRYLGKFRTGGTTAEAFPDEATLAGVVVSAVRAGAPMKFTAGLHHAVRFRDEATGFEHHGFLNLLVAVHAASQHVSEDDIAAILRQREAARLASEVQAWSAADVVAVRRAFVSFGCCGVDDPVADLIELGLLILELESR